MLIYVGAAAEGDTVNVGVLGENKVSPELIIFEHVFVNEQEQTKRNRNSPPALPNPLLPPQYSPPPFLFKKLQQQKPETIVDSSDLDSLYVYCAEIQDEAKVRGVMYVLLN